MKLPYELIPAFLGMLTLSLAFSHAKGRQAGEAKAEVPDHGEIFLVCESQSKIVTTAPLDNGTDQKLYCSYKLTFDKQADRLNAQWEVLSCESNATSTAPTCETLP